MIMCFSLLGYSSLSETQQVMADIGMYQEFPLPGAVGVGIQPWMRPECNVVWEVGNLYADHVRVVYVSVLSG